MTADTSHRTGRRAASLMARAQDATMTAVAAVAAAAVLGAGGRTVAAGQDLRRQRRLPTPAAAGIQRGGSVTGTVRCTVDLAKLANMSGIPGSMTASSTSTAPIDTDRTISLGPTADGRGLTVGVAA